MTLLVLQPCWTEFEAGQKIQNFKRSTRPRKKRGRVFCRAKIDNIYMLAWKTEFAGNVVEEYT